MLYQINIIKFYLSFRKKHLSVYSETCPALHHPPWHIRKVRAVAAMRKEGEWMRLYLHKYICMHTHTHSSLSSKFTRAEEDLKNTETWNKIYFLTLPRKRSALGLHHGLQNSLWSPSSIPCSQRYLQYRGRTICSEGDRSTQMPHSGLYSIILRAGCHHPVWHSNSRDLSLSQVLNLGVLHSSQWNTCINYLNRQKTRLKKPKEMIKKFFCEC